MDDFIWARRHRDCCDLLWRATFSSSTVCAPSWVPFPNVWAYVAGAILLAAGIGLAVKKQSRISAASIGALMTVLTLSLYLLILIRAHGAPEINEGLNYVADTLLYAGAALVLASALPREPDRAGKT